MNFSFDILSQISSGANMFSPAELKLSNFILMDPERVLSLSISDFAESCEVSVATVSRFCKRLSLNGYSEFRMELAKAVSSSAISQEDGTTALQSDDSVSTLISKVQALHAYALSKASENLDPAAVTTAATLIDRARDVHFFGTGSMLFIAMIAEIQFMQVSPKFQCAMDAPIQALNASLMTSESVAVVFSYTGSTRDIVEVAKIVKEQKATLITITRYAHSPLADISDVVLICGVREGPFQMGSAPVKTGMLYIIDVLYTEYCRRRPEEAQRNKEKTSLLGVIGKIHPLKKQ